MTNNNNPLHADFEATVSTKQVGHLLERLIQDPAWFEIAERLYRQSYTEALVAYLICQPRPMWDPVNLEKDLLGSYLVEAATKDEAIYALLELLEARGEIEPIWLDQDDPHDVPPVVDVVVLWNRLLADFHVVEGPRNWFIFRREPLVSKEN